MATVTMSSPSFGVFFFSLIALTAHSLSKIIAHIISGALVGHGYPGRFGGHLIWEYVKLYIKLDRYLKMIFLSVNLECLRMSLHSTICITF